MTPRLLSFGNHLLFLFAIALGSANAYELRTHGEMVGRTFDASQSLKTYLDDVGINPGDRFDRNRTTPREQLADFNNTGTLRDWMIEGAIREDDYQRHSLLEPFPFGCKRPQNPESKIDRPLQHFLDVQRGGRGLVVGAVGGIPAPDWALGVQGRGPADTQNQFSILDARAYHLRSLTAPTRDERNRNTALLFRSLGQVIHVLQDMAQPQHTRNDPHAGCVEVVAGHESVYETYLETRALGQRFRTRGEVAPPLPLGGYTSPRVTTYQDFWATADRKGLADFSSRNFFSAGTNLSVIGNCSGLMEPPCSLNDYRPLDTPFSIRTVSGETVSGSVRLFLRNIQDPLTGATLRDVPVSSRSLWDEHLEKKGILLPTFTLNTLNYDAMSDILLPRAVGYSAGLLDHFFRGKLDVDVVEADPSDPSQLQLTGTNASTEVLRDGSLSVYADDPTGVRNLVTSVPVTQVEPNTSIPAVPFQAPEDAERFVAVYQGTLGQETRDDSRNIPGAVIGKVLGGVRVEEVFSDGTRWHLRTPLGVFPLPISGREIVALRWGDRDNTLVGRTLFGRGEPNQFFAYEIARPAGSSDVPLLTGPDGSQQVNVKVLKQVTFPYGIDLGTTVEFAQTIHYTQHLFSFVRTITQVADCPNCSYRVTEQTVSDGRINLMVDETRTVTRSFPLRLDRESQFCCGARYSWFLRDVGFTATGQILALVSVGLRNPLDQVTFPAFTLDLNPGSPVPERREFPPVAVPLTIPRDIAPALWALVDVGNGRVVASTAPATLTISQTTPFAFLLTHPFFLDTLARVFVKERFFGGSLDGFSRDVATDLLAKTCPEADQTGGPPLAEVTFEGGGLEAAVSQYRPEIAQAQFPPSLEDLPPFVSQLTFLCPSTDAGLSARLQVTANGRSFRSSRLEEVRRTEPRAGAEQLVLLVARREASGGSFPPDQARLVTWIPGAASAEVRHQLLPGFHSIESVSSSAATVFSRPLDTTLVPLEGPLSSTLFPSTRLSSFVFVLLEPSFLYNTQDLKFYRKQPPLQRTALPARLAPLASGGNPVGSYHTLRVP